MRYKRPIVVSGDIALVPLTKGHEAVVDAADVPLVSAHNWQVWPSGNGRLYAARKHKQKTLRLHHVIMPPREGYEIDHIDGNGLNNRRTNLRYVTHGQNKRNTYHRHKGVYFSQGKQKYYAIVHLGHFETANEARDAYWRAVEQLFPGFVPQKTKGPAVA